MKRKEKIDLYLAQAFCLIVMYFFFYFVFGKKENMPEYKYEVLDAIERDYNYKYNHETHLYVYLKDLTLNKEETRVYEQYNRLYDYYLTTYKRGYVFTEKNYDYTTRLVTKIICDIIFIVLMLIILFLATKETILRKKEEDKKVDRINL